MKKFEGMTDEALALLYVKGNNSAFDELLSRTQSKLFTYIMFVVHDHDVADDIFQETFFSDIDSDPIIHSIHNRPFSTESDI